jgi:hypothetical protein
MLRRVALIRTDVSTELSASIIKVTIGELGTTLAVTSNLRTLCDSCHPNEGGAKFLRNIGSYKSHTAQHPRRRHSSIALLSLQGDVCPAVLMKGPNMMSVQTLLMSKVRDGRSALLGRERRLVFL